MKTDIWVSGSIAAFSLGISVEHLNRLRKNGTLKKRIHFKDINPRAKRATYRYHLPNLEKLI